MIGVGALMQYFYASCEFVFLYIDYYAGKNLLYIFICVMCLYITVSALGKHSNQAYLCVTRILFYIG